MRSLLFHCKNYKIEIGHLATRPNNIKPEKVKEKEQSCQNCVVAFITIELGDKKEECCPQICEEIAKVSQETKHNNVVIFPFAHLSNNLATSEDAINILNCIETTLKSNTKLNVLRAHFGSDKAVLLDVYGHAGNTRYREF